MALSAYQTLKLAAVGATNLFADALHIHVGLLVLFATAFIARKSLASLLPWSVVLVVMVFGEVMNMRQDLAHLGHWRWQESLHGLVNAMFWPTTLLLIARYTSLFGQPASAGPRTRA